MFNTNQITPKTNSKSIGVQVMKPKNNSKMIRILKPDNVKFTNHEYYRKNIPATGNYILKDDKIC